MEFTTQQLVTYLRTFADNHASVGDAVAEHINTAAADRLEALRGERDWFAVQIVMLLHDAVSHETLQEDMILRHSELYRELLAHLIEQRNKPVRHLPK